MKLELIKETRYNGDVVFSVEKDGIYISNTLMVWKASSELPYEDAEAEALKMYNQIKVLDGKIKKEVIISSEI